MDIKEELLYDFGLNLPRILVSGKTGILDNVKKLVMVSESQVIVHNGARYTAVTGKKLTIKQLEDERMMITGEIERIEFYGTQQDD